MQQLLQTEEEDTQVGLASAGWLNCAHGVITEATADAKHAATIQSVVPLGENSTMLNRHNVLPAEGSTSID